LTARLSIEINGASYYIVPETFVEGAIRRQVETQQIGQGKDKSRPGVREFWQTSWIGGSQWEKPVYSRDNLNTYFQSADLSLTDTAGAVQQSGAVTLVNSSLRKPSSAMAAWAKNSIEGAVSLGWDGLAWNWYKWQSSSNTWVSASNAYATTSGATDANDEVFASSGGNGNLVYAIMKSGWLVYWDTSGVAVTRVNLSVTVSNGTSMWVDADYVWIYNSDLLYRFKIASSYSQEIMNDDDSGLDVYSASATFTGKPVIPEWSNRRAIRTAEGIFYIKNVFLGGLPVCQIFRVDRDASGSYINTPVGSLSAGTVGLELGYHLSSLLITTVNNFYTAVNNTADQRVTIYHVTGGSVGAIGSPLGGDNLDETPVWFLGAVGEQYLFGGRKRIWQYDPRVGAFHVVKEVTATKYLDHGSGFCDAAFVKLATSSAIIVKHSSQDATTAAPYNVIIDTQVSTNSASKTSYLESNWIDFGLPMEQKSITELYYDSAYIRTGSTVQIQILADSGSFTTVATLTGGTSSNTSRITITSIKGYKFRYKLIFSDDSDTTSLDPGRILSIGFTALAGEMVEVMQFTIDGNESMNINNAIQVPKDVYNNIATLRANDSDFTVKHYYQSDDGADSVSRTMRVASITGSKAWPGEGKYDVVLIEA